MRKIDNYDELFDNWINKVSKVGIEKLEGGFSNLVIDYCKDMSLGLNISKLAKKGGRSKKRINNARQKIIFVLSKLQERKIKDITKIKREDLHQVFEDMRNGTIKNRYGKPYLSTGDYVKDFKTFYHWYMKKYKFREDITDELDRRGEKPTFIYFTEEEFNKLLKSSTRDTQISMALAWDTGARPKELWNIQVKDFSKDFKELQIKEETSKTFGRKIKVMFCSDQIKNYIKELDLKPEDYLIKKSQEMTNNELNQIGLNVLGEDRCKEKKLTLYDFRHSSACFWVVRYKSESALKYRFGWKKSEMIHYYTEFLGMKDTIQEDDLYLDVTKTELEKRMDELETALQNSVKFNMKLIQELKENPKETELVIKRFFKNK